MKITNAILIVIYRLLTILLIISLCYGLYHIAYLFIQKIDTIDNSIFPVIITGFLTIIGYFVIRYIERKKEIEQKIREQKIHIYEEFINYQLRKLKNIKSHHKISITEENELIDIYWDMKKKSILWLSDDTFKDYLNWENKSLKNFQIEDENIEAVTKIIMNLTNLMLKFRKDIGHKNKDIDDINLPSLVLYDIIYFLKENMKNKI
jgi:hypothetical protein